MDKHVLEITDIFRGAFFLCHGGDLCGIRMDGNHAGRDRQSKKIATFLIQGEGLNRLDKKYRNGPRSQIRDLRQALVNPLQFRESLNHLRDILFNKLREQGPASCDRYAGAKGGTRYDRKRRDRGYQKRR